MIDTKSLKRGNIVSYEATYHVVIGVFANRIKSNWIKDFQVIEDFNCYYDDINEQYSPVVLTKELLLRLGFTKSEDSNTFTSADEYLVLKLEDDNWDKVSFDVYVSNTYGVTYVTCLSEVHHLQNLYSSLMFQELKLS